ncbi:uncharacterized protein At1g65710 [Cucumis melo]|uniref:Uncharacterized protein At1g65710 n=1 Tax=Cucumis melo TaxID=3656 RepID=A0A1S3CIK4_CUCME|nr:uncharacterized protein At1g65710 [Cucumis melo]
MLLEQCATRYPPFLFYLSLSSSLISLSNLKTPQSLLSLSLSLPTSLENFHCWVFSISLMGACLSKKKKTLPSISSTSVPSPPDPTSSNVCTKPIIPISQPPTTDVQLKTCNKTGEENGERKEERSEYPVKKEVFVIKHRKSHDGRDKNGGSLVPCQEGNGHIFSAATPTVSSSSCEILESGAVGENMKVGLVRTSSCTKEEVDAILIQCGRLSRSSSAKGNGRKYSGSKRSYDFDHCDRDGVNSGNFGDEDEDGRNLNSVEVYDDGTPVEKRHHQRQRHRQSPRHSSSQGRRRTPSRERDQNQRSSSRERRVSRSPGRRSAEPSATNVSNNTSNVNANTNNGGVLNRPAKMVSVPATVSHVETDKNNSANGGCGGNDSATVTGVKRISVKRNVGEATAMAGSRVASSPRSQSPARNSGNVKASDENQQQPSLSRSSSRKAEQSPYRRNPLSEIDTNSQQHNRIQNRSKKETEEVTAKDCINGVNQKPKTDSKSVNKVIVSQVNGSKPSSTATTTRGVVNIITSTTPLSNTEVLVVEHQKPQGLARSRSARHSRELDINPETLLNQSHTPSYTKMLLQDIQNFHQKNTNTNPVSLPACVTKACSIVEAVADLNSTTSSNFSCAFSEDRSNPPTYQSSRNEYSVPYSGNLKGTAELRDPFVESEVMMDDDILEPSFHKYVTVRRGGPVVAAGGGDTDDQESSGSNSYVGSVQQQHHWGISTASWEPNTADSNDSRTSRQHTKEEGHPHLQSKPGLDRDDNRRRAERRRDSDAQRTGIGRGRLGNAGKVVHTIAVAATGST